MISDWVGQPLSQEHHTGQEFEDWYSRFKAAIQLFIHQELIMIHYTPSIIDSDKFLNLRVELIVQCNFYGPEWSGLLHDELQRALDMPNINGVVDNY